jgi:orotidine-5'-phosphate decarboxylase
MLNDFQSIDARDRIIVALDCDGSTALSLADRLKGHATWVKVGMTLYYAEGPSIIAALKRRGFKVFLDLKFHDIPHQIYGATRSAVECGADMLTMHCAGGEAMMQAACKGAAAAQTTSSNDPILLGITVLTSMDQAALSSIGIDKSVSQQVTRLAGLAHTVGLSGVVASPQEAHALREQLGAHAYIVTPGVRPQGSALDDQSRVATPQQAFDAGASHLVIGRPITQAADPVASFESIVESLGNK